MSVKCGKVSGDAVIFTPSRSLTILSPVGRTLFTAEARSQANYQSV
jgi:hypothetical protein